jgi:methylglyoxal synthase
MAGAEQVPRHRRAHDPEPDDTDPHQGDPVRWRRRAGAASVHAMRRLRLILIAHDTRKDDLVAWARINAARLAAHELIATAATGAALRETLGLELRLLLHGPEGGDAQAGSLIATGAADMLFFFWEPLQVQPHDVDVKALLRLAVLHNVPIACNRSTADYLISSPLFGA